MRLSSKFLGVSTALVSTFLCPGICAVPLTTYNKLSLPQNLFSNKDNTDSQAAVWGPTAQSASELHCPQGYTKCHYTDIALKKSQSIRVIKDSRFFCKDAFST